MPATTVRARGRWVCGAGRAGLSDRGLGRLSVAVRMHWWLPCAVRRARQEQSEADAARQARGLQSEVAALTQELEARQGRACVFTRLCPRAHAVCPLRHTHQQRAPVVDWKSPR
eukprot:COSAG01_NODE_1507_length_10090_cov_4.104694_9_plen_114_part_00